MGRLTNSYQRNYFWLFEMIQLEPPLVSGVVASLTSRVTTVNVLWWQINYFLSLFLSLIPLHHDAYITETKCTYSLLC